MNKGKKLKGYIILKKMNKYTPMETSLPTVTSYSFHGPMTQDMADYVNYKLQKLLISTRANILQFDMDIYGRFIGRMNNEALIIHEEDFLVVILEAMKVCQIAKYFLRCHGCSFCIIPTFPFTSSAKELGYTLRFQYSAQAENAMMNDDCHSKLVFILQSI